MCDICWNEVGGFPSALDQHRRWNLECLRWQHYNEGDCSWEEARDRAMQTKMRRDARAIVEQSRTRDEPSAGGKRWPRDDLRDRSAHMERSAPKSVIVKVHEKKKKKRRSRAQEQARRRRIAYAGGAGSGPQASRPSAEQFGRGAADIEAPSPAAAGDYSARPCALLIAAHVLRGHCLCTTAAKLSAA
jgi:hypothetical protein